MPSNDVIRQEAKAGGKLTAAIQDVEIECHRHRRLVDEGRFSHSAATMPSFEGLTAVGEELGEACRALLDWRSRTSAMGGVRLYRTELVQIAATAVSIVAGIDADTIPDLYDIG